MITLDFETRSACELKRAGPWVYSLHETTSVLCAAWMFDDGPDVPLWHRAHPSVAVWESDFPEELADRVADGEEVEAHNSFFEWVIWNHVWRREVPRLPKLRLSQMRCTAAKAAQFALPRSLDGAGDALKLPVKKDMAGSRVMLKVSKPRKARKSEHAQLQLQGIDPETAVLWNEDRDDLQTTWGYCRDDVLAERCLSRSLRPMMDREVQFWQMDQRMNARGVLCDVKGVQMALRLADDAIRDLGAEVCSITGGEVPKASSRDRLKRWCNERGAGLPTTEAAVIEETLKARKDLEPEVRRVLSICVDANRTSTSKYKQMLKQVSPDGRIRDLMLYYGASRTGRWAGKGVQPHNFVRGYSKDMEQAWQDIHTGDAELIALLWGSVMECLAKAMRGALIAPEGRHLIVADFAAIEARALLWLAMDEDGLGLFHRGEDPYLDMAEAIYRVQKGTFNKKQHPLERQLGKKAILGLGYGMGDEKFDDECANDPFAPIVREREFFTEVVRVYRKEKYPRVPALWAACEDAAIKALKFPGEVFDACRVRYGVRGRFLHCRLPSGRLLSYYAPSLRVKTALTWQAVNKAGKPATIRVPLGGKIDSTARALRKAELIAAQTEKELLPGAPEEWSKESIHFWGINGQTKKFERQHTYGGSLVENITQATARDLMAEAMLRADETEVYDVLLSVHDELIGEVDEDKGDVKEFEALMATLPEWAEGCPVAAEGWRGKRYKK